MMQSVIIAMTVVGCNHQATQCERLPQPVTQWESRVQCEADIPGVVRKPDFPIVIARCDEKVVVAIAAAPETKKAPDTKKPVGAPLDISPLKVAKTVIEDDRKTVAGTIMRSTKHGYIFVRDGAWGGYEKLRDGTAVGYTRLRGGIAAMVAASVKFAGRTADAILPGSKR